MAEARKFKPKKGTSGVVTTETGGDLSSAVTRVGHFPGTSFVILRLTLDVKIETTTSLGSTDSKNFKESSQLEKSIWS